MSAIGDASTCKVRSPASFSTAVTLPVLPLRFSPLVPFGTNGAWPSSKGLHCAEMSQQGTQSNEKFYVTRLPK